MKRPTNDEMNAHEKWAIATFQSVTKSLGDGGGDKAMEIIIATEQSAKGAAKMLVTMALLEVMTTKDMDLIKALCEAAVKVLIAYKLKG